MASMIRRPLFAVGVGLLCAGVGAYLASERGDITAYLGFGGGIVALTWKPWRLDAWS